MKNSAWMKSAIKTAVCLTLALVTLFSAACTTQTIGTGSARTETPTEGSPSSALQTEEPGNHSQTSSPDGPNERDPALHVTELMVHNLHCVKDSSGAYRPWIELYNRSAAKADLKEYRLYLGEKEIALPDKTLSAGEYLLLFTDSLPNSGTLTLYHREMITDEVRYLNEHNDYSFLTDHGGETGTPTPGYENVREADALVISEVAPKNNVYPVNGVTGAFIELFNPGNKPIDLGNYYFSLRTDDRYIAKLPDVTIAPGEYIAFPCAGELHFALSSFASTLYLTRNDGVLSASLAYPEAEKNRSFSGGEWQMPSPGYPNTDAGRMAYASSRTGLVINEILPSNTRYNAVSGEYYDLVELKNTGKSDLLLSDYYLSDKQKELQRYRLPEVTLKPGELYTLILTGKEGLYCPFKLSSDGELLIVSNAAGQISDALEYPRVPTDRSWGRSSAGELVYFSTPTIGKENGSGFTTLSGAPSVSLPGGFYDHGVEVTLSGSGTVYYTLDSSRPTVNSRKYAGETISVEKSTTLRAICVEGEKIPSDVVTFNYFINALDLTLPVVKMSVVDSEMFGPDGIYTKNVSTQNRDDREIEGHVALYVDGKEEFSIPCGVKVFGNYSRKYDKKSYQLKFRAVYGVSKLKYDVFGDGSVTEFNSLVLRSGSQDYEVTMMRDEVVSGTVLVYGKEVLAQNYRPCNLYINDEYIGVYYIREKINQDFVATHWGVDPDTVSIMQSLNYIEKGPAGDWYSLKNFIEQKDLSVKENYDYICSRFNIQSVIDYYAIYTWADNRDNGNTRLCRSDQYDGGRWHFIFYDSDMAFGLYLQNKNSSTADYLYGTYQLNSGFHNALIYKLFQNETFRDLFLKRLEELCKTAFSNEVIKARIEGIRQAIDHDMKYTRFGVSYNSWTALVPRMVTYVTDRSDKLRNEFAVLFHLSESDQKKYFGKTVT